MKSLETNFRLIAFVILVVLVCGFASQNSLAQTVTVSPGDIYFGVPTGTTAVAPDPYPASAPDNVTVNITCAAPCNTFTPVVFGTASVGASSPVLATDKPADFIIAGDSCSGKTFTSAATCQVSLYFNSSLAPVTTLETAALTIPITSGATAPAPIPLNGAYGAIKLFGPLNINPSLFPGVTWTQNPATSGETVRANSANLMCTAGVPLKAVLSSTPDGLSNVFQDNTMQFVETVGATTTPTTNVCTGGDPNFAGFTGFPAGTTNCFQQSYESAVGNYPGQNPDLAVYPTSGGPLGSFVATYGVPPIDISALLSLGTQAISVQEQDAGGFLGSSSLFLVTSCSPGGVVPGASVTGDPTPTNTVAFDSNPGNNFSVTDSTAQNPPPGGTTPVYTQIAVPQQLFYQLVKGTSAAPDVCLRVASEEDPANSNAPMCAGILIQCWDPTHTSLSGNNCDASAGNVRDLYEALQFTSPDAPVNEGNFLYGPVGTPAADACSYYLSYTAPGAPVPVLNASCAMGTGAGVLMGGDTWLCGGSNPPQSCTSLEPNSSLVNDSVFNTLTTAGTQIYTEANDALTGGLAGDLSPLGILTQFLGAADSSGGGSVPLKNSVFFLVANHPLPTATATVSANGWVNSSAANVSFTANSAAYPPSESNPIPSANGFVAAPVYSLTYGITPAGTPVPDTTYPVPGDQTLLATGAAPSFGNPLCSAAATNSFSPAPVTLPPQSDGLYNLHYFATDCALTEGLVFNPTNVTDPTVNWASFPVTPYGIDTVAPTFSAATCLPAPGGTWYGSNITVTCMNAVTDQGWVSGVSGSGFPPLLPNSIQGSQTETVSVTTSVAGGSTSSAAYATSPTPPACDLAVNCVAGGVSVGPYQIDLQAPTIIASAGSSTVGGTAITVAYTCSDAGSGIPVGGCTISGTPANYAPAACIPSSGPTVICGGMIPTSMAESGMLTVSAKDSVGNLATPVVVNYAVNAATPTITFGPAPTPTYPGSNFTVSASTNSNGALSYSYVSGPCAFVSGATFSSSGTGTCVVKASTAATTNYLAGFNTQNVIITSGVTLSVKPTSLNFGTLYLGQSGFPQFVIVTNIWSAPVVISSVTTAGGNAAGDFGDLSFCSPYFSKLPGTLPAGKSCVIGVDAINVATSNSTQVFSPTASTATLTITPSIGSAVGIPMSVLVINPLATLSASKLTFPTTTVNTTSQMSVTLTNNGNTPLNIGTLSVSGKSFALASGVNSCTNGEVINAPSGSCTIYVNFTPSSKSSFNGSVTITDNAWKSPQTISLSGSGK